MDHKAVNAFIGVGSNIDPERNITDALMLLSSYVEISGISSFYKTMPLSDRDQDDYLNGVWQVSTSMSPRELKFDVLKKIEEELERLERREESDKYVSRTIDLDLLLFGDLVITEKEFVIPDPDIYSRSFIAYPLSELSPDLIVPDTAMPITAILSSLSKDGMRPDTLFTESLRKKVN